MEVSFRGQVYEVAHDHYLGRKSGLYGLRSRFTGGSIFPAAKTDCRPFLNESKPHRGSS